MTDVSPQAQAIIDAADEVFFHGGRIRDGFAAALRVLADELSHTIFLPGNDCRVIDASSVYKIADELEQLK